MNKTYIIAPKKLFPIHITSDLEVACEVAKDLLNEGVGEIEIVEQTDNIRIGFAYDPGGTMFSGDARHTINLNGSDFMCRSQHLLRFKHKLEKSKLKGNKKKYYVVNGGYWSICFSEQDMLKLKDWVANTNKLSEAAASHNYMAEAMEQLNEYGFHGSIEKVEPIH